MISVETILATLATKAGPIVHSPFFIPAAAIIVVFSAVVYGAYVVVNARPKAVSEVSDLLQRLEAVSAQLIEAEKTGHVGTFSWNFENQELSFWSEEMYGLFGLVPRRKPPTITSLGASIHETDREQATLTWERALNQPGPFEFSFRTVSPDGVVRQLRVKGKTVLGPNHIAKTMQGIVHDITKEVEVDRAKTEFVSLASHQLKTPLTSIKWLSEGLLAAKDEPLTEKQKLYVDNIHESSRHMVEMVNDLLNMSRIELGTLALTISEFDLVELSKSVWLEQRPTAEQRKIQVDMRLPTSLPKLKADTNLVRMILQNLLSNAIKYTPEGGSVIYELTEGTGGTGHEILFLRVTDTGIGIPKSEQDKMFNKLYRAQNAQSLVPDGTGLGLYVVKTILDRAGGGITFESVEGKGTTFYVSIPLVWEMAGGDKLG